MALTVAFAQLSPMARRRSIAATFIGAAIGQD
jgi:hypothetical protein